jgi:hypothetical protein
VYRALQFLVVCSIALCGVGAARADSDEAASSGEPAVYRATVDEALKEFEAQNYEEARSLFLRAHALYPNARTHRALGLAEFELRNYGDSIAHLRAALEDRVKPLGDAMRAETQQVLTRAYNFVGRVRLEVKPSTAHVTLDGAPLQLSSEPLLLPIGEHTFELEASGFIAARRQLSIKGGEERSLSIVLVPVLNAQTGKDEPARAGDRSKWYKSPWLWVSLGVVVAGAGATTAYFLTRPEQTSSGYGGSSGELLTGP